MKLSWGEKLLVVGCALLAVGLAWLLIHSEILKAARESELSALCEQRCYPYRIAVEGLSCWCDLSIASPSAVPRFLEAADAGPR